MTCLNSCSSLPERNYSVKLYLLDWDTGCISRKIEDKVERICKNDPKFPTLIGISPEDYAKERNYQDQLKEACK